MEASDLIAGLALGLSITTLVFKVRWAKANRTADAARFAAKGPNVVLHCRHLFDAGEQQYGINIVNQGRTAVTITNIGAVAISADGILTRLQVKYPGLLPLRLQNHDNLALNIPLSSLQELESYLPGSQVRAVVGVAGSEAVLGPIILGKDLDGQAEPRS
jgi:hypothetical protein